MLQLKAANEWERRALDMMQTDRRTCGLKEIKWDALTSAVAREHSKDMAEHDYFAYTSSRLGTISYRLHRAGVSAPGTRCAIFRTGSLEGFRKQLSESSPAFHTRPTTHLGIGIFSSGLKGIYVTLIAREKHTTIEPFPTLPLYGRAYRLAGTLAPGFRNPKLVITQPNGKIVEPPLKPSSDKGFDFHAIVVFDQGKGKYTVEILAQGKLGPVTLDIMHCYAGVAYPRPPLPEKPVRTPEGLREAERMMFEMVNRARTKGGLSPLKYDERLAAVARSHSRDMMRNGFVAHISPTRGDITKRMEQAKLRAMAFTENLATNRDIGSAHRGLMDSPGHRKNILHPNMNRIGIGIVRSKKDKGLFITQNFAQDFPTYDTAKLEKAFLETANKLRTAKGLKPLKSNATLSTIALENSRWMQTRRKLGGERAGPRDAVNRAQLQRVQTACFQLMEPLTPEKVESVLDGRYTEIGISMVQGENATGAEVLWVTVLVGEKR